jgi:hypothetical protein
LVGAGDTDDYRALAFREENVFTWFWIGPRGEYDEILKRG